MPYSLPSASGAVAVAAPPTPPPQRPNHRRSYTFAADDPMANPNHGAFASLGALPRRTRSHSGTPTAASPRRTPPQFHFRGDEDNDSSESSEEQPPLHDDDDGPPPPLRLRQQPPPALSFRLTPPTARNARPSLSSPTSAPTSAPASASAAVPFPRASPISGPASPAFPLRPAAPVRTASHPVVLLSNGKPLKSSLKSSSSAPHMPSHHLRARSAPSTPSLSLSAAGDIGATSPEAESPGTPKNVHFPAPDNGLETVLLFKRSARPASVGHPDEETETETETDRDSSTMMRWAGGITHHSSGFPFPRSPLAPPRRDHHNAKGVHSPWRYALDAPGVPRKPDAGSMVLVESLRLVGGDPSSRQSTSSTPTELTLTGTLLARNAAFEKHLFVRFTLDGWCTTSEVGARWEASLSSDYGCAASSGPDSKVGSARRRRRWGRPKTRSKRRRRKGRRTRKTGRKGKIRRKS
ncbi:hypothetical protein C8R44DRAFT_15325 [Mycena epipterygia]|nr:hypothetical protein C8R44DRAFT_15325 [Mycena epipterygia]